MEPKDVMAVARGFMRSRIILTAVELDLFTRIGDGTRTAGALAAGLGCDARALARVLDCCVTFGLLSKEGDAYALAGEGATYSSRHPETARPMLLHMSRLWDSWSDLTEVVRQGPGAERRTMTPMDQESRTAFIGAMHVIGRTLSEEIADSLDLGGFKRLLDVGGGSGTYTIAFLKKNPGMEGVIFDLKDVIPMAGDRLRNEGLLGRVELVAGDFYADELPKGCDLALLSAIIHQNGPQQNLELYKKIMRALEPGGSIVIRDHIMDASRTDPPEGALFAINMLVNTREGDTYTFEEVRGALAVAGFEDIRLTRKGERMDCLVEAKKPGGQA
jgi:SAM-dependent methyltransferase